jgi:hypothetical protein
LLDLSPIPHVPIEPPRCDNDPEPDTITGVKRWIVRVVVAGAIVFVALQFVPLGRVRNPPVTDDAPWPSAEARSIAVAACYDCHSNEARVEWFDKIAPASWLVASHVDEGRDRVNFSEWDQPQFKADEMHDSVEEGEMPLSSYTWLHPKAKLDAHEREVLVDALRQMEGDREGRGRGSGDDDRG